MELTRKKLEQLLKNMVDDLSMTPRSVISGILQKAAARTFGAKDYNALRAVLEREFAERKAQKTGLAAVPATKLMVIPGDEDVMDLYALAPAALTCVELDRVVAKACQELTDARGNDEWKWQDLAGALRPYGIEVVAPERASEPWDRHYQPRLAYLDFTPDMVREAFGHECPRYDREDWGQMIAGGGSRGYYEYAADSLSSLAGELAGRGYAVDYDATEDGYSFITPAGNPSFPYETAADAWIAADRHESGDCEDEPDLEQAGLRSMDTARLEAGHRAALAAFDAAGGRGVELAEQIDGMRRELLRRRLPKLRHGV